MERFYPAKFESLKGLITEQELVKLHKAKVALLGLGAGSNLLPILAREGVASLPSGLLILADPDQVEEVNLTRTPYNTGYIGMNKALASSQISQEINQEINIQIFPDGVTPSNIEEICKHVNVIQEMIDIANPDVVLLVHDTARKYGIPVVTGMDLASGTLSYVFRYDQLGGYSYRDFLGLPKDLRPDDLKNCNPIAIAAQLIIGPHVGRLEDLEEISNYYGNSFFNSENLQKLLNSVPQEMIPVIQKILNGEIQRIPQSGIAGTLLGTVHAEIVNRLVLGYPLKTAPEPIKINISEILTVNNMSFPDIKTLPHDLTSFFAVKEFVDTNIVSAGVAITPEDKTRRLAVVTERYLDAGYILSNDLTEGLYRDRYEEAAIPLVAKLGNNVVASFRLIPNNGVGLPINHENMNIEPDWLDIVRASPFELSQLAKARNADRDPRPTLAVIKAYMGIADQLKIPTSVAVIDDGVIRLLNGPYLGFDLPKIGPTVNYLGSPSTPVFIDINNVRDNSRNNGHPDLADFLEGKKSPDFEWYVGP